MRPIENRIWLKIFAWHTTLRKRTRSLKQALLAVIWRAQLCTALSVWHQPDPLVTALSTCTSPLMWVQPVPCGFFPGLRRWIPFSPLIKPQGPQSPFLRLSWMDWALPEVPFLTWICFQRAPSATQTEVKGRRGRSCFRDQTQSSRVMFKVKFG